MAAVVMAAADVVGAKAEGVGVEDCMAEVGQQALMPRTCNGADRSGWWHISVGTPFPWRA